MKKYRTLLGLLVTLSIAHLAPCHASTSNAIASYPKKSAVAAINCTDKAMLLAVGMHIEQGNAYFRNSQYNKAIESYSHAIKTQPGYAPAYYNLGLARLALNDNDNALASFLTCLTFDSDHVLANYFAGYIYQLQKKYDNALPYYNRVIQKDPTHFNAHINRSRALANLGRIHDAIASYQQALALNPRDRNAHFELGYLYERTGNLGESIRSFQEAAKIDPTHVETASNLAHVLRLKGNAQEAVPFYKKVLENNPESSQAHQGIAECYLATGDLENGFEHLEWRLKRGGIKRSGLDTCWDGTADLVGKTILVRAERSIEDTIQFARYIPLLKKRGAHVIFEVQKSLKALFGYAPYIDEVVTTHDKVSAYDYHIALLSLPHAFKTTMDSIPTDIPYLHSDATRDMHWEQNIVRNKQFKIGVRWQSDFAEIKSAIPAELFASLAQLPGVTLYNFQHINGFDTLVAPPSSDMQMHTFDDSFDVDHGQLVDTASALKQMDLVVCIDDGIAHLSGSLGVPTWILLPQKAHWRWLQESSDSPWYPTVKLFRQESPGDWEHVMACVITAIEKQLFGSSTTAQSGPVAEISIGELVDKMTILEIKSERINDHVKLRNIRTEQQALKDAFDNYVGKELRTKELFGLMRELKGVNEELWDIEDDIRAQEARQEFGDRFITLARSVYFSNDKRGSLKRAINDLLGSNLVEEKLYTAY